MPPRLPTQGTQTSAAAAPGARAAQPARAPAAAQQKARPRLAPVRTQGLAGEPSQPGGLPSPSSARKRLQASKQTQQQRAALQKARAVVSGSPAAPSPKRTPRAGAGTSALSQCLPSARPAVTCLDLHWFVRASAGGCSHHPCTLTQWHSCRATHQAARKQGRWDSTGLDACRHIPVSSQERPCGGSAGPAIAAACHATGAWHLGPWRAPAGPGEGAGAAPLDPACQHWYCQHRCCPGPADCQEPAASCLRRCSGSQRQHGM